VFIFNLNKKLLGRLSKALFKSFIHCFFQALLAFLPGGGACSLRVFQLLLAALCFACRV
jgi:hypothetical protein